MGTPLVSLWNMALGHLGVKSISLNDETSPTALALTRAWDVSRREALGLAPVSCSIVIKALAEISGYVVPADWLYAYQYPPKALRVWKIYNDATADKKKGEDYRVVFDPDLNTKVILSKTAEATAEYSYDVADTNLYDPSMVTAMSFVLAQNVAMDLVTDKTVAAEMMKAFQAKIGDALRLDSYEQNVGVSGEKSLIESRG